MLNNISKFEVIETIYLQYSSDKINWLEYPTPEFAKAWPRYMRLKINDEPEWSEPTLCKFEGEDKRYYEELDRNQPLEKILMGYWYSLTHKIKTWWQQ